MSQTTKRQRTSASSASSLMPDPIPAAAASPEAGTASPGRRRRRKRGRRLSKRRSRRGSVKAETTQPASPPATIAMVMQQTSQWLLSFLPHEECATTCRLVSHSWQGHVAAYKPLKPTRRFILSARAAFLRDITTGWTKCVHCQRYVSDAEEVKGPDCVGRHNLHLFSVPRSQITSKLPANVETEEAALHLLKQAWRLAEKTALAHLEDEKEEAREATGQPTALAHLEDEKEEATGRPTTLRSCAAVWKLFNDTVTNVCEMYAVNPRVLTSNLALIKQLWMHGYNVQDVQDHQYATNLRVALGTSYPLMSSISARAYLENFCEWADKQVKPMHITLRDPLVLFDDSANRHTKHCMTDAITPKKEFWSDDRKAAALGMEMMLGALATVRGSVGAITIHAGNQWFDERVLSLVHQLLVTHRLTLEQFHLHSDHTCQLDAHDAGDQHVPAILDALMACPLLIDVELTPDWEASDIKRLMLALAARPAPRRRKRITLPLWHDELPESLKPLLTAWTLCDGRIQLDGSHYESHAASRCDCDARRADDDTTPLQLALIKRAMRHRRLLAKSVPTAPDSDSD